MIDLKGQRVLVVGGTSGIGLATARLATQRGAAVTVASRSGSKVAAAVEIIGPAATGRTLDVTDEHAVQDFFGSRDLWDHVVTTASAVRIAPVRDLPMVDALAAMDSKFWGAYRVARHAAIRDGGSLSFLAGYLATRPAPGRALMTAINAGLEGLARGLALEFRPVRVNAVSPAFVDTPLWDGMQASERAALVARNTALYPAGRVGTAEDVAAMLLALISNPYATGTVVTLDGGASLV